MRWQLVVENVSNMQIQHLNVIKLVQHGLNVMELDFKLAPCETDPVKTLRKLLVYQGFGFCNNVVENG